MISRKSGSEPELIHQTFSSHEWCRTAPAESAFFNDLADQRVTVGVHTGRCQANDNITFCDVGARKHGIPFDRAHSETRKIVIITVINTRHFRRFAADQGATGLAATDADTCDNGRAKLGLKLSAGVVVEKK